MGELILCKQMLAALPYYIDEAAVNIYSLEELNYYIGQNIYLLDAGFMNEELCAWVERELHMKDLAKRLRECYRSGKSLAEFVSYLLKEAGYYDVGQINQMLLVLEDMEHKSEYECIKLRADRYMENTRFENAVYEYQRLLKRKDAPNEKVVGDVYHNIAVAYAKMFRFKEAVIYFKKAYEKNNNPESIKELLYACYCMDENVGLEKMIQEMEVSDEMLEEVQQMMSKQRENNRIEEFEEQLQKLILGEYQSEINKLLGKWKDTYRKNCRI